VNWTRWRRMRKNVVQQLCVVYRTQIIMAADWLLDIRGIFFYGTLKANLRQTALKTWYSIWKWLKRRTLNTGTTSNHNCYPDSNPDTARKGTQFTRLSALNMIFRNNDTMGRHIHTGNGSLSRKPCMAATKLQWITIRKSWLILQNLSLKIARSAHWRRNHNDVISVCNKTSLSRKLCIADKKLLLNTFMKSWSLSK